MTRKLQTLILIENFSNNDVTVTDKSCHRKSRQLKFSKIMATYIQTPILIKKSFLTNPKHDLEKLN